MPERERDIVTHELIRGFNDVAVEAETRVTGGQTVMNPWPIIGGAATAVCSADEFIQPDYLAPGDVMVLTKALGTQPAVNAHQWHAQQSRWWEQAKDVLSPEEVEYAYNAAMHSMARLNRNGAKLMMKYKVHGGTDVTGLAFLATHTTSPRIRNRRSTSSCTLSPSSRACEPWTRR
eukprot:TRINITY_DN20895_c0_g1_i1.p1 TRINITY_DN20895_c0_g1~~TRINITY_DN20895_c0_g1_i1.p1  ORF type:complete len:206 (-),score=37.31 TRINITY_DN20895_c0_g1_i1:87-614(-)